MTVEALIDRLAQDLKPVRRRRAGVDMLIIACICAAELAIFFALGAARPDMMAQLHQPTVWWRLSSLGMIAGLSCALGLMSFNPVFSPKRPLRWLALMIAIALALGLVINAGPDGPAAIMHRVNWHGGVQCMYKIVLLSAPLVIGLALLMRRGAPTEPRGTAILAGLGAASWGAFVFVFACPSDDPLYILVWYSAACGIVAALSRIILPRVSKW